MLCVVPRDVTGAGRTEGGDPAAGEKDTPPCICATSTRP